MIEYQVGIKQVGRTVRGVYRAKMVNGEWEPTFHRCTLAQVEDMLDRGVAEMHPGSIPLRYQTFTPGEAVVYTCPTGTTYSATVRDVTQTQVVLSLATGGVVYAHKRTASARCEKFPTGAMFFVPAAS